MSELLIQEISAFGDFAPSVPFADGIDKTALINGDDDPMFVTLPIGRVNARSHNGRVYPRKAVESIVKAINEQRNGGNKGHLRSQDRSTRFDLPILQWVGAILHDDGKAYGKAYIPRYATDVREYIKNVKAVRGRIATSIYGSANMDGDTVVDLEIETIDLVDPNRAGVPDAIAEPIVTAEMITGDKKMSDNHDVLISELRTDRNNALQELAEMRVKYNALEAQLAVIPELEGLLESKDVVKRVTEMKEQIAEMQDTFELIGELKAEYGKDIRKAISELKAARDTAQRKTIAYAARDIITELVEFENARPIIANMVGMDWTNPEANVLPFANRDDIREKVEAIIGQEPVQEMVKAMVLKATGGRARVGENLPTKFNDTQEERQKARNFWGF